MALVNPTTGNYVKITGFQFDFPMGNHHINYLLFKDLEQRQRYESGIDEFEQYQSRQFNGMELLTMPLTAFQQPTIAYMLRFLQQCTAR